MMVVTPELWSVAKKVKIRFQKDDGKFDLPRPDTRGKTGEVLAEGKGYPRSRPNLCSY